MKDKPMYIGIVGTAILLLGYMAFWALTEITEPLGFPHINGEAAVGVLAVYLVASSTVAVVAWLLLRLIDKHYPE